MIRNNSKRNSVFYLTLVCSARGTRLALTIPQEADPTLFIYVKACRVFEVLGSCNIILGDLDKVLSFIEETDFSSEESLSDWN